MKNLKKIMTGMMLVLALGAFTACGENTDNNADESGTMTDNKGNSDSADRGDRKQEDSNRDVANDMEGNDTVNENAANDNEDTADGNAALRK